MKTFSKKETTDNSFEALKIFGNSLPYQKENEQNKNLDRYF